MQATTRDAIVDMFRTRLHRMHRAAREVLLALQQAQQAEVHRLLTTFGDVLAVFDDSSPAETVAQMRTVLDAAGGTAQLQDVCCDRRCVCRPTSAGVDDVRIGG
ncbi:MAG TPA: hypothetical protein VF897_06905 [Roseiflexaceae bacterium]